MRVVYYEGERIYFSTVEPTDEPTLRRWINDPAVWRTVGMQLPLNELGERAWLERVTTNPGQYMFGIVVREGDRLIGTLGLEGIKSINRRATLGIAIGDRDYQNRGYGTEAVRLALRFGFEELNLNRVQLHVMDCNERGIRAYEKAGFQFEGRLRQAVFRGGRFHDMLCYAVLREQWEQSQAHEPAGAVGATEHEQHGETA